MERQSIPLGYRENTAKQRKLQKRGSRQHIPSNIGNKSRPLGRNNRGMRRSVIG